MRKEHDRLHAKWDMLPKYKNLTNLPNIGASGELSDSSSRLALDSANLSI